MIAEGIFYFLSGLGILLFGVSAMSGALEKVAGGKVRKAVNKFSKNRFQSFGFGLVSTFLLQSSTASSIMFVGFASSGILTLFQAISMIVGSNVGTTLTSFLLSFKSINAIEILSALVLVGVIIKLVAKNQRTKDFGSVLIGLGLLFVGMLLIDDATAIFQQFEGFVDFVKTVTNPILLILVGFLITIITQSSFGTIAILISLAGSGATAFEVMSLQSMAFVVYGANIGTCVTALIVSLNCNANGKRVALFHLLFNVLGTIIFSLLEIANWTNILLGLEPGLAIILINVIFNLVTSIIILPFLTPATKLMEKIYVKKNNDNKLFEFSAGELEIPTLAVKNIYQAMTKSFVDLKQYISNFKTFCEKISLEEFQKMKKALMELSAYNQSIKDGAVKISTKIGEQDAVNISVLIEVCQNYERVVHNFTEILDSTVIDEKPINFTKTQVEVILNLSDEIINIVNAFERIYYNVFNENYNFNFQEIADGVMQCTNFISEIKNSQKKRIMTQLQKSQNKEKFSCFLNITNQFDEIGNDLNDMNVNLAEMFVKGEE